MTINPLRPAMRLVISSNANVIPAQVTPGTLLYDMVHDYNPRHVPAIIPPRYCDMTRWFDNDDYWWDDEDDDTYTSLSYLAPRP